MDSAKKLTEQAQEKLDEAQKSFNQPQSPPGGDANANPDPFKPIQ